MKIVFDLDGVLRDLFGYLSKQYGVPYPDDYTWEYKSKDIWEWALQDSLKLLKESPCTEYYDVIMKHYPCPEIWTHQIPSWRKNTIKWADRHLGDYKIRFLTMKQKRARLDKHTDTWLVEDSPQYSDYSRILLISRKYNEAIRGASRIHSPKQLEEVFVNNYRGENQHD